MTVVLKDNLVKASHHNIVMGMGIKLKKPNLNVSMPVPLSVRMGNLNVGGSLVGATSQVKRKPISFF